MSVGRFRIPLSLSFEVDSWTYSLLLMIERCYLKFGVTNSLRHIQGENQQFHFYKVGKQVRLEQETRGG